MVPLKLMVTVDRDEDGVFVVECPAVPGCISQGSSEEEALANIRSAIVECLDVRKRLGWAPTLTTREVDVAFQVD